MSKQIDPKRYFESHSPKPYYARNLGSVRLGAPGELIVGRHGAHLLDEHVAVITDHAGSQTGLSLDNFSKLHGGRLEDVSTPRISPPFRALRVKSALFFQTGWGEKIELAPGDVLTREEINGKTHYDGFSAAEFTKRHFRVSPTGKKIAALSEPAPVQKRAVDQDLSGYPNKKAHLQDIQEMKKLGLVRADEVPRVPVHVLQGKTKS